MQVIQGLTNSSGEEAESDAHAGQLCLNALRAAATLLVLHGGAVAAAARAVGSESDVAARAKDEKADAGSKSAPASVAFGPLVAAFDELGSVMRKVLFKVKVPDLAVANLCRPGRM